MYGIGSGLALARPPDVVFGACGPQDVVKIELAGFTQLARGLAVELPLQLAQLLPERVDVPRLLVELRAQLAPGLGYALVERVVARIREWGGMAPVDLVGQPENVVFSLPRELRVPITSLKDRATTPDSP